MNTVIFLGAGASMDAGYPGMSNLLDEVEKESRKADSATKDDWEHFDAFRKNASGILRAILNSPNPELVLTVPDLLEATLQEANQRNWEELKSAMERGDNDEASKINKRWSDPIRGELVNGRNTKLAFQRLVDHFFSMKHARDSDPAQSISRGYLHNAFSRLGNGDVVITTNWDTLAERVLMETEKWLPSDGYGFQVCFETGSEWKPQFLPKELRVPSSVKVLKLHGSVGWFRKNIGQEVYLRHANYLQYMVLLDGYLIRDKNEPAPGGGPPENPMTIFPSYLKQIEGPIMQSIWDQAVHALNHAEELIIIGYSLPSADVAVRALINPVRQRFNQTAIKVTIVDPSNMVLQRWREFLGDGVRLVPKTAKEHFSAN